MTYNGIQHFGEVSSYAYSKNSQGAEDGMIEEVFKRLGIVVGTFVDIGSWDGIYLSNTRRLYEKGWKGIYFEGNNDKCIQLSRNSVNSTVFCQFVDKNIKDLLKSIEIQEDFDFLNIDIDGNDYWVWEAIEHQPKLVCVEYNSNFHPTECKSIAYDPNFRFCQTRYFGASAGAMNKLAKQKDYSLIGCSDGLNLLFIHNNFVDKFKVLDINEIPVHHNFVGEERIMLDV